MSGKPCSECPWLSKAERDVRMCNQVHFQTQLELRPQDFTCHVHMGTCFGAMAVAKSKFDQKGCQQ